MPSKQLPPAAIAVFIGLLVYGLLLVAGPKLLNDPDTQWQIVLGNWMLSERAVPRTDAFSFTKRGEPWISSQWLAQVLFALAHRWFGWLGVIALTGLACAAAFALQARFLLQRLALLPAVAATLIAILIAAPHITARPHVLAFPLMVAWFAGLWRANEEGRAPPWWLLIVVVLWANVHGGFTLAFVLLAGIALDAIVSAESTDRLKVALRWALFGVASVAAACATPYGSESLLVTYRILGMGDALRLISEWRPFDFATFSFFEAVLLAVVAGGLMAGVKLPPVRVLIVLGLLHLALSANRNTETFALLAPMAIALPLGREIARWRPEPDTKLSETIEIAAFVMVIAITALASLGTYAPPVNASPQRAIVALKLANAKRVFNDYDFGGAMIAAGIPTFIDGRTELFGRDFMLQHHRATELQDLSGFLSLLERYEIEATLLRPSSPAAQFLDRMTEWKRIYADDTAVVHARSANEAPSRMTEMIRR
ncbi:hypothetical protein GJW-30_1_02435 [Variibacter gotjawalensis]|uniref:Glycosyltransferase RgtA/B/C/D-like domain-containing protein n=2 Tax=Variibacter gotjawalensis TaxID=1333996 RepID=A0A0S3PVG7_9BRAD|nr:hypothetical protein [Variibacter gotjawalensis]RZS47647.1 hypothetical protein EV661_0039 [Variibacter gotjawalensis]BAT59900.1 hypothetical protein GJW-30_1_02435 [Variibacter gotjawalensis]